MNPEKVLIALKLSSVLIILQIFSLTSNTQTAPTLKNSPISNIPASTAIYGMDKSVWAVEAVMMFEGHCPYDPVGLALDSKGNPHFSFMNPDLEALFYVYSNGTERVITTVEDNDYTTGRQNSIALDSQDRPMISYIDMSNEVLKFASLEGDQWIIESVGENGQGFAYTHLSLDAQDRPMVGYMGGGQDVRMASHDGNSWTIQVADPVFTYLGLGYAVDSDEKPHFSYLVNYKDLQLASLTDSGWITETVDIGPGNYFDQMGAYSSLVYDSYNHPHLSYAQFGQTFGGDWAEGLRYATYQNGAWYTTTVADESDEEGYYSSIQVNSEYNPAISYFDKDNQAVRFVFWDGNRWVNQKVFSPVFIEDYTSLALDENDVPHIAFCSDKSVYYAKRLDYRVYIPWFTKLEGAN